MKTKEIEVGEQKFTIASLTVDQYEQFIGDGVTKKGKEFIRAHMVPIVAASLENAAAGNGKWFVAAASDSMAVRERKWTDADVSATLDFGELEQLYGEIIQLSGLKTSGAKPGEAAAATNQ